MNGKKIFLLVVVFVAMVLLVGAGVEVAQAGGAGKNSPLPPHVPVCQKVPSTAADYYELRCSDRGGDIASVDVTTNGAYKLDWTANYVTLIVFASPNQTVTANWHVYDQAGNSVSGILP